MNSNLKKAILIFGGGLILFYAFKIIKPVGDKKSKSDSKPINKNIQDEAKNSAIVLKAYIDAANNGESTTFLNDMNTEFAKTYKLRVYVDKVGNAFVTNLQGDRIG